MPFFADRNENSMIIDFHTHTFPDKIAARTLAYLSSKSKTPAFTDGTVDGLSRSMKDAGIDYSVGLSVATVPEQTEKINSSMIGRLEELQENGIIPFGAMHPQYENFKNELRRIRRAGICGIKLHPPYQQIDFDDLRYQRIVDAASEEDLIILVHAGIDIGITDRNYTSVGHILTMIDTVKPEKLVLAHMGSWACWDEVASDLAGVPVWLDTSFSIGPVQPSSPESVPYLTHNLSDEDFLRLARSHGMDRILFATDSPWMDQSDYVQRFAQMDLTDSERAAIMGGNAARLLGL